MRSSLPVEIAALDQDGIGLKTIFTWQGGHYTHAIHAAIDGRAMPLLEAASIPPFQEVVTHHGDRWPALLLTGAGDGRYWSATVTSIIDGELPLLSFDFACRRRRDGSLPSVAYRLGEGVKVDSCRDETCAFHLPGGRAYRLRAVGAPTGSDAKIVPNCRVRHENNRLVIEPLPEHRTPMAGTVQWRYEIATTIPS